MARRDVKSLPPSKRQYVRTFPASLDRDADLEPVSKVSRFFWHKLTHSLEDSIDQPRLFGDPLTELFTLLFSLSGVAAVLVVAIACSFGSTRTLRSTVHPGYVEADALAEQAAEQLRKNGPVVNDRPNPWLIVQEKSVRGLVALSM